MYMHCLSLGWRLYNNVLGHNRLNTPIASAIAVIHLHTSVKSSSTIQLYCIPYPRRFTLHRTMAFHVLFATAVLCLTATLFVSGDAYPQQSVESNQVSEACLGCLCESIGECSPNMKCSGEVCGMFGITWPYWSDSGKPVVEGSHPNDPDAYQKCANNPVCAKQSVISYMHRFAQDCNNDGVIDCYDFAAIHKLGGFGCRGNLPYDFKTRFSSCQNTVQNLSG